MNCKVHPGIASCVNYVEIETKDNIILLGVVLHSKPNFSEHIISLCKKASQRIGILMRLRILIPMKSKLYYSKVQYYHSSCIVTHCGIFAKRATLERLKDYKEEDLGRFSRTVILVKNNY